VFRERRLVRVVAFRSRRGAIGVLNGTLCSARARRVCWIRASEDKDLKKTMARAGVEEKPRWRDVPPDVRRVVGETLGARVARALRVWGGYGPTPTFRLRLADGRGVFMKAVGPRDNEFSQDAFEREVRVYHDLRGALGSWAPAFYGHVDVGAWRVLLLEDLGPKSVPPWTPAAARGVSRAYADFHRSAMGMPLPSCAPAPGQYLVAEAHGWERMAEAKRLGSVAALAGIRSGEALSWLRSSAPTLLAAASRVVDAGPPHTLLHGDTRSDNLRWVRGRLILFDWPSVGTGPAEYDLAAFAQSVTVEGGPEPERIVDWYAE